ncbi:MAG TPA: mitochondrial fission ELM1 family protein [Stellaceae bacterium]|jgi:mitochondrial fission protein ELM1|nr:mitochondrial fission ELM1 family protein [Stellaceae bacterium]
MTSKEATPRIWALHDGKSGMANQVLGLAEALGWPFDEKRLVVRAPWRHVTPHLWLYPLNALDPQGAVLAPPWPDLIIACGRNTVAPARAAKRRSGGKIFWVQIQDPRFARREVDLVVAPRHDGVNGANSFSTLGAVHRVNPARLADGAARLGARFSHLPRPLLAVLIGGDNAVYRLTDAGFARLCEQLAALARQGFGLAITPSRRTAAARTAQLRAALEGLPAAIWDGSGDNPYFAMLGLADAILVTADSVSMVSEAAATGKPVYIVPLEGGSAKFARFHRAMREAGITRDFAGAIEGWTYEPPDDTARAAAEIRRRLPRIAS